MRPSLKLRAALIFMAVFATVFLAGFVLLAWSSLSTGGERHHAGPTMVLNLAARQARLEGARLVLSSEGALASLAERNPAMWLLARTDASTASFGAVPEAARHLLETQAGSFTSGRFHVPGMARPLSDASIERLGAVTLAAGGVDPATISLLDALAYVASEGLLWMLLALGLVGLVALLVALPLLTAALGPVTRDAAAIGADAPQRRIADVRVPSELLPLVRAFNAALDRLSAELQRRRRFVTDVAHELRTPLAVMSLQVDSLPPGERRTDLQRVVGRMSQLVGQLLDVERLSLSGPTLSALDLAALAREVVAELAPIAISAGYELSLDAPQRPVPVRGDAHALARAVANLVSNAIAHGGGSGQITVTVGDEGTLEVADEGPGVPGPARAQLFEPFFRERHDRDGCGMGLHLCREILRAHGGEAALVDSPRGARFRLSLPRVPG